MTLRRIRRTQEGCRTGRGEPSRDEIRHGSESTIIVRDKYRMGEKGKNSQVQRLVILDLLRNRGKAGIIGSYKSNAAPSG